MRITIVVGVLSALCLQPAGASAGCPGRSCRHVGGGSGHTTLPTEGAAVCAGGAAGSFPCRNVDLAYWLSIDDLGGGEGNDSWGWRDDSSGREFALMGRSTGTAFVEVTDPTAPVYLGDLPSHVGSSPWRDVKVYAGHAFIVSEANGHGMQVFDLSQLLDVVAPPVTFTETAHDASFGHAHNIAINEDTGYAYVVGSDVCAGGLHMIDISVPTAPTVAGCFDADGYTHDVQCVVYSGPDAAHVGSEICLAANVDSLTIVDVTVKGAPVQLSRTDYAGRSFTHQGWLTGDQRWVLFGDEGDELDNKHNTRTYIVDVSDLDAPVFTATYTGPLPVIDHNEYVVGNVLYEANYTAGLRLLDLTGVAMGELCELGYIDLHPADNDRTFEGAWNVYPFFASGTVLVSTDAGLGVVVPDLAGAVCLADPPIVQNGSQEKCLNAMSKAGSKVAKAQGKDVARCIKNASRRKIPDGQACLVGDLQGKVAKAAARTAADDLRLCTGDPPTFGYTSATAVNASAVLHETALWNDIFGPDLGAAVFLRSIDRDGASCQASVARFYDKVMQARLKAFDDCKKTGLQLETITNRPTLEVCFDEMLADTTGRIGKATSRFGSRVTAKCGVVDLNTAFPGLCTGAGDFASCVDERGLCRICLLRNGTDGLGRDCDILDDTIANGSCPP